MIETATFGGGCYWCTEAMFQQLRGVIRVENGFSAGHVPNPSYARVCAGTTGHAEVIQITFDNQEITYEQLLKIHLSTHNPTTLNQQGADKGTQYRSIILPHNPEQRRIAEQVLVDMAGAFDDKIVTEIKDFDCFYPAEQNHQNYYQNNQHAGYCQVVIEPKLEHLRELCRTLLKSEQE